MQQKHIMLQLAIVVTELVALALAVQQADLAFGNDAVSGSCRSYLSMGSLTLGSMKDNAGRLASGACHTWAIDVTSAQQACYTASSMLVVDFWAEPSLLDGGSIWQTSSSSDPSWPDGSLSPSPLADQVFVAAAQDAPPMLGLSNDVLNVTRSTVRGVYYDSTAISTRRAWHRVQVTTIGQIFSAMRPTPSGVLVQHWYVTVANLNPANVWLSSYSLRAQCVAAPRMLPCPSPTYDAGLCGADATSLGLPAQGQCTPSSMLATATHSCVCSQGYGDSSCGSVVNQLDSPPIGSAPQTFVAPPRTWTFFGFTVPNGPNPRLLLELSQPAASGWYYDPIIVLLPTSTQVGGTVQDVALPTLSSINFNSNGYRNIPQKYTYMLWVTRVLSSLAAGNYYIGVLNNKPLTSLLLGATPPGSLSLRVQVDSGSSSAWLCPQDCSGHGTCKAAPIISGASYQCVCDAGWEGPMCEGRRASAVITSQDSYSASGTLAPGAWQYTIISYSVLADITPGTKVLAIYFQAGGDSIPWVMVPTASNGASTYYGGSGSGPLFFILSPMYTGTSVGDQYFDQSNTYAFGSTVQLRLGARDLILSETWVLAIYNNDVSSNATAASSTYSMSVWATTASDSTGGSGSGGSSSGGSSSGGSSNSPSSSQDRGRNISTWYIGLVGAVGGAGVLAVGCLIFGRMVRWRLTRYLESGDGLANGRVVRIDGEGRVVQMQPRQQREQCGLPPEVINNFLLLRYMRPPGGLQPNAPQLLPVATDFDTVLGTPAAQQQQQQQEADQPAAAAAPALAPAAPQAAAHDGEQQSLPGTPMGDNHRASGSDAAIAAGQPGTDSQQPEPQAAPAEAAARAPEDASEDDPLLTCSVCLCDYEDGNLLRKLPCLHMFHASCIDVWLATHDTCPMCRICLLPEELQQQQRQLQEQQQREQEAAAQVQRLGVRVDRIVLSDRPSRPRRSRAGTSAAGAPAAGSGADTAAPATAASAGSPQNSATAAGSNWAASTAAVPPAAAESSDHTAVTVPAARRTSDGARAPGRISWGDA